MKSIAFFLLITFCCFSKNSLAQAEMSPDEMAILKVIKNLEDAWTAKDGVQYASSFADDHDFIVWTGMYFPNSNKAFNSQSHQGIFNSIYKNWDVEYRIDKFRFVRPDLALVHVLAAGRDKGNEVPPYPNVIQSVLLEKTGTGWQIISFHNLNIEYDLLLHKNFTTDAEKEAYAMEHYQSWYR